ncbi:Prefoldin subunit [Carpediemonas membranifera]|uniref:Prefoldin subunit 3 n=1 Tax=Carpediemonas membranifera TaxID=201153 RepID=A0A8J6BUM3_9EUKA|nr:Prefoldin subunit [Carpediemonas membranifera]|eukprot:KAG9390501.1 Prefoldin subunit [Carpediemonas membranifera]
MAAKPTVAHRGIPQADFIDNPNAFIAQHKNAEEALTSLNEQYSKYKFMDAQLIRQKTSIAGRIPDLEASLKTIQFYQQKREETTVNHEIADGVYAKATVPAVENVSIWLGCSTMVEYPIDDAEALLKRNLAGARAQVAGLDSDLDYLKEQITTLEVSLARVYNADVLRRRQTRA